MRATGDRDRRPSPHPRPDAAPLQAASRAPIRKSSRRRRYLGGAAALVVAGVVAMGFMGGGTAMADGADSEIVFNGKCGVGGLGNKSEPDKSSMDVTSGDTVKFTNNLGRKATLHVGSTESTVEEGKSKSVELSNSTEVMMSPKCTLMLKDNSETATVNVQPRQDPGSGGDDGDTGNGDDGDSNSGGDSGDDSSNGDSDGDKADKPEDSPDTGKKPKAEGKAGDPNKGDDDKDKKKDDEAVIPGDSDSDDNNDAAKVDATNKVSNENSASGLLAALAALCLAGVGFAAIRTFLSSRAAATA
ncbi:MAG: hypothetical protein ACRD0P_04505 [Stackebrandtia sp.]